MIYMRVMRSVIIRQPHQSHSHQFRSHQSRSHQSHSYPIPLVPSHRTVLWYSIYESSDSGYASALLSNSDSLFSSTSVHFTYTVSYRGGAGLFSVSYRAPPFRELTLATSQRHYVRYWETRNVRRRSYTKIVSEQFFWLQPESNQEPNAWKPSA